MKRLFGILILLGIIFLFFLPSLFLQKGSQSLLNKYKQIILVQNPQQENLSLIYSPFRKFDYEQLRDKHIPFWNPYIFGGAPFFADDQSAVLSVYTLIGSLFPYKDSLLVASILKLIITGLGMYLLLGLFALNTPARLLGSMTWMFSAFMMTFHIHHTAADAGSFIPWFFYFFERMIRRLENNQTISRALSGLVVSVGLSLFAGHAETTIVGSIGLLIYALVKALTHKTPAKMLFYTFIGLLLGFLIASVQLVPFLAIILHSEPYYLRSHATQVLRSMPLWTLIMWLVPGFSFLKEGGTPVLRQSTTYIGITALIVSAFSLVEIRRHYKVYMPFLITMIIAIGIGYVVPPFSYLLKIPIIRLGGAFRFLALAEFSIAVLAGFGMNTIYRNRSPGSVAAIVSVVLTLLAVGLLVGIKFDMLPFISALNHTLWIHYGTHSIGINVVHIILLGIFIFVVLFIFASRPSAHVAGMCLLLLSMGDLFTYGMFGMAYNPLLTSQDMQSVSPFIRVLMQRSSPDYTFYSSTGAIKPNSNMLYGLRDFSGFDIVVSRHYQKLLSVLFTDAVPAPNASGEYNDLPAAPDPVMAGIAGIKYYVENSSWRPDQYFNRDLSGKGHKESGQIKPLRRIYTDGSISLWENPNAKPIIYLPEAIQQVTNNNEALHILSTRNPQLLHIPIVAGIDESGSIDNSRIKLTRIKDKAGEHVVKVYAQTRGFMVINEPSYPGWHAYMDGKKIPIYHVNYLFQGIKLSKGSYTVKIIYMPKNVYLGLIISVLTFLIVVCIIAFRFV